MLRCYGCKKSFDYPSQLTYHQMALCKEVVAGSVKFLCGHDNCNRHFSTARSLKQHITKIHLSGKHLGVDCPTSLVSYGGVETIQGDSGTLTKISTVDHGQTSDCALMLDKNLSGFVSRLYSHPMIPRNVVQFIIENLDSFLSSDLKEAFKSKLLESGCELTDSMRGAFDFMFSVDFLKDLRTEHKRFGFFERMGTFIRPREIAIGYRKDFKRIKNVNSLKNVKDSLQLIPLREVLTKFFSLDHVLKDTLDHMSSLPFEPGSSSAVINLIQGTVWQNILTNIPTRSNTELVFPIIIYYDDFEVGNALGSHAGIHKLGGVYISLPGLPPHYTSKLGNIFLLALFHSSDRVKYGNSAIFGKIIDELNLLSREGVSIYNSIFKGTIKFVVSALTGDNLGLNGTLGFVENFIANYCCRVCTAHRNDVQTLLRENKSLLRTLDNYNDHLLTNDAAQTGIKEKSVWLSLKGFDIFEHVATDILHDWLEGCCKYVMAYIINVFVNDLGILHFDMLKKKVVSFNYGPDSDTKPVNCFQQVGKSVTLKTSASEMLTLVRYFGLIAGYYVPTNNEHWYLYQLLRKITDRLLNLRVFLDTTDQLEHTIAEFNQLYIKLAKTHLKPKFHFLTHYPQMLKKFGPLTQVWTMRFEARHRVLKIIANSSCSRVNICKTISIKNQLIINDFVLRNQPIERYFFGKKKPATQKAINEITLKYGVESEGLAYESVTWIKTAGSKFQKSSIVTVDIDEQLLLPIFASIQEIVVTSHNDIYFLCSYYETLDFDEHVYSYEVKTNERVDWLRFNDLLTPVPNTLTITMDLLMYVTLRSSID